MDKLYIDSNYGIVFKENDGKIIEIFNYNDFKMGNIYLGRIQNVDVAQEAIFVDIGEKENVYLDYEKNLNKLDIIPVQIIRSGDEKASKVSSEISIANKYFVVFPFEKFTKFSKKLKKEDIETIKEIYKNLDIKRDFGILFRTESKYLNLENFEKHLLDLIKKSNFIKNESTKLPVPRLLHDVDFLNNYITRENNIEITTNDENIYKKFLNKNIHLDKDFSIIYNIDFIKNYKSFFKKKVPLLNGGEIVIEHTKALCAIDVNSKDYKEKYSRYEEFLYNLNKDAAKEIVNQIICRNISGIIIIDFLKMKEKNNYKKLKEYVKKLFFRDYTETFVYNFTKLGLLEISRKNYGLMLKNTIGD